MSQKKILIIDDIDSVRRDIRNYINPPASAQDAVAQLIQKGALARRDRHQVDEAGQGQEGVNKVKDALDAGSPYDIAVVDMMMPPGINGVETIRRIRKFDKDIVIIICTGNGVVPDLDIIEANDGIAPPVFFKPEIAGIANVIRDTPNRRV